MEIRKDIWQQVIAPYLNQKVWLWNIEKPLKPDLFDYRKLDLEEGDMLLLKPLSAITDEDAIEVSKLFGWKGNEYQLKGQWFKNVLADLNRQSSGKVIGILSCYQFLQSRGYDLPNYLLNGKTLHECNLCIYE